MVKGMGMGAAVAMGMGSCPAGATAITTRAQEMAEKAKVAILAQDDQYAKEVDQHLKDTWKEDYENNKTFANRAIEKLFGEDYADFKQLATKNDNLIV